MSLSSSGSLLNRPVKKKVPALNLVSLMDIFTILVFFLLMNSGDSQEIEKANFIQLPDSVAKGDYQDNLLITIGDEYITIKDEEIVSLADVKKADGKVIEALAARLSVEKKSQDEYTPFEKKNGLPVTIMGDQAVSYVILKSVMATCSQENYRDIALAVNQVVGGALSTASVAADGGAL